MKHSSAFRSRVERSRRPLWYRPILESLERRLPPGSLFTSLLLGGSALALEIDQDMLDAAVRELRKIEKVEVGETLSLRQLPVPAQPLSP